MSVYVGIDVHRKRSQVAVVTGDGQVRLNRNVVNGTEPILRLIGDLPAGTPVAFEAAFGTGWLVQLLRADLLPEAWIAPPQVRQLRALLRHRAQLVRLRTLLRNRIHAVLADYGHGRPQGCWSGPGRQWLASLELPAVSREVIDDDLAAIDALQPVIDRI